MKIKNLLPKAGAILIIIIAMASCQEDISSIGSEILGSETPNGILYDSATVVSYSKKLPPVQSNRLPVYQFGVYNDPVYGKSTANLLSQLTLEVNDPKFGDSVVVDSVYLYLPYFSNATTVDSTTTYTLDSIYGNSPININISRSNYFLRNFDPDTGFEDFQNYYSDQGPLFKSYLVDELASVNNFIPTANGFVFNKGEENEEKLGPGLRVKLNSTYFEQKIIEMEGTPELRNSNNFKDYFRGIYFDVTSNNADGSLFLFDASKAYISIYFSRNKANAPNERENKTFKLNFGGINVNTFKNELPQSIKTALEDPDTENGEENLYIRGGDGIISVVELFGPDVNQNGLADELEKLRQKNWLINEANLIFYVNQDLTKGGKTEPERIIIYDLKNSNVLLDYTMDLTNGLDPIDALNVHLGRLERGNDENGDYYKLRITNYISSIINDGAENVPLGVIVSQNVLNRTTQELLNPIPPSIEQVPSSAVISPEGTVLYGNKATNLEKRLKLQIYYTEPK